MNIQLDHLTIPSKDRVAAARQLADLLGVAWGAAAAGPFTAVYVSDSLTLDFDQMDEPFPVTHVCFRVDDAGFDAVLGRLKAAGVPFRSSVRGPQDQQEGAHQGGRLVYWNVPDGHQWELLTVSYARKPA